MKIVLLSTLLILFSATVYGKTLEDSDRIIKTVENYYTIQYQGGGSDDFVYVYTAHLRAFMSQGGAHSSWLHPIDTRTCDYVVESYIMREGFYITGSGKRIREGELDKKIGASDIGIKNDFFVQQLLGKNSPCHKSKNDFNAMKARISNKILDYLAEVVSTGAIKSSEADAKRILKASSFVRKTK